MNGNLTKDNMRVLFMGTPEFAVHILDKIKRAGYQIVGVVTTPDKPAGRGQKMHTSAVKKYAQKHNLAIYQPTNLKSDEFQKDLQELNPDVSVVVAFRMLPKSVWNFPAYGTFNLHASLLPQYRGAAPINWAIINGEKETGVTTFFLDENIDTGHIIFQDHVFITAKDNAGTLHDKLMESGANLVVSTLDAIRNNTIEVIQQENHATLKPAPKLNSENTQIDWGKSVQEIQNLIRGLNPYPVAYTYFKNGEAKMRCKIFEVGIEKADHSHPIGKVMISKNSFKVAAADGWVEILEMQLPGKRKMGIKDILNGLQINADPKML